ncbi:hypothetical protein AU476_40810 [Cupriavidus sp. UYMSc13B]|nr:hypothetical protein AU476_40810 [Cupriavidus sp. UYMSc13B]
MNEMVAGETPLVMMASSAETAELLVKAGANIEAKLKRDATNVNVVKGATAIIKAAHDNNEALVAKLIELGADVKPPTAWGARLCTMRLIMTARLPIV